MNSVFRRRSHLANKGLKNFPPSLLSPRPSENYFLLSFCSVILSEYLVFKLLGQFVEAEVRSAIGRADAVVKTADTVYVFEFKLTGTVQEALLQINDRSYLLPYTADRKHLVKVGVAFDAATRNLGDWIIETE